jgi:hypothetical protein
MRNYFVWTCATLVLQCFVFGQQPQGETGRPTKSPAQADLTNLLDAKIKAEWQAIKNKDQNGRENTMFIAFTLEAVAVFALLQMISHPVWFIALSGLCFFAWGEIFSLFPSITGDLFGKTWATTNYGIVYTAKGTGALFAGAGAAWLFEKTGSWTKVFWAMIACDLIAAFMALLWLKPLAVRTVKASESSTPVVNLTEPIKA